MPIHVDIRINEQPIKQLHIGRLETLQSKTQTSLYTVVEGDYKDWDVPYEKFGTEFYHKYDEGVLVCIQKAIEALEKEE